MPRQPRYRSRTRKCYCPVCDGTLLPWSTWSSHQQVLLQQDVRLQKTLASSDSESSMSDIDIPTRDQLRESFKAPPIGRKMEQKARIRGRLIRVHENLILIRKTLRSNLKLVFTVVPRLIDPGMLNVILTPTSANHVSQTQQESIFKAFPKKQPWTLKYRKIEASFAVQLDCATCILVSTPLKTDYLLQTPRLGDT